MYPLLLIHAKNLTLEKKTVQPCNEMFWFASHMSIILYNNIWQIIESNQLLSKL